MNGYPEIAVNLKRDIKFVRCRRPNSRNGYKLNVVCYHMCFVFDSDEDCYRKINTWGHSHQFNIDEWYKRNWKNWTL